MDKRRLRTNMRKKRRLLSEQDQDKAAKGLLHNLTKLKFYNQAKRLSLYFANDGEIDPTFVMIDALDKAKRCYYPIILPYRQPRLYFVKANAGSLLKPDRLGILTPINAKVSERIKPSQLQIILLPLVAFDATGSRIGMGGGFYDASLSFLNFRKQYNSPKLIGVAHEIQKVDKISTDNWDIPLHMIVTDKNIYVP